MKMIINGEKRDAKDGASAKVYNVFTGEVIDTIPMATKEDAQDALCAAQIGKKLWADTSIHERKAAIYKFVELLLDNKEEVASLENQEIGRPYRDCVVEIESTAAIFKAFAEKIGSHYGRTIPQIDPGSEEDMVISIREPLGVVVCIIPYNAPPKLFAHKVASALIAGNAVIVKPATEAPLALIRMVELLLESDVIPQAIQIITGRGSSLGDYLIDNPSINAVSFTGSTDVGSHIAAIGAKYIYRTFLELGGNDAFIVCEDADIEYAAEQASQTRLVHSGQICISPKRFIVQNTVKDAFVEKLIEKLKVLTQHTDPGDEQTIMSYMISEKAAIEVQQQVQHTVGQGAKLAYGNQRKGALLMPAVLVDVTRDMDIAKDMEIFGPVFPVIGFDTMDEAIDIANQSAYGLSGGIITKDIYKAIKAATQIQSGNVVVNGSGFYRTNSMPFGGYKMSGLGKEGVASALDEMTQEKTIVLKAVLA